MTAVPSISHLGSWEEVGGPSFVVFHGGGCTGSCGGRFVAFTGRGFVAFNRGIFVLLVVFLGFFLTSFDFLVSLDFKLGNTSLQRSWGCYAPVGRQVASFSSPLPQPPPFLSPALHLPTCC